MLSAFRKNQDFLTEINKTLKKMGRIARRKWYDVKNKNFQNFSIRFKQRSLDLLSEHCSLTIVSRLPDDLLLQESNNKKIGLDFPKRGFLYHLKKCINVTSTQR